MKHLKTYNRMIEDDSNQPQIGDYVICKDTYNTNDTDEKFIKFIDNNIGKFVKYTEESDGIDLEYCQKYPYLIEYDIPKNLFNKDEKSDYFTKIKGKYKYVVMSKDEIIHSSPNIEDLLTYINIKKFNL